MKVVTFETSKGKVRYYLADDSDVPVESVLKYLKFEDHSWDCCFSSLYAHCISTILAL